MNIISPLTLLIVPLIGSLIILSFPYLNREDSSYLSASALPNIANKNISVTAHGVISKLKKETKLENKNSQLKKIAIITSLINFILSIFLWIEFDSSYIGYQFVTEFKGLEFIQLNLGVDGISLFFVLLTTFITPIALLSSHQDINKNLKFYLVSILLLETLQIAVFVVLDLLLFYIFFESVLIPLFFIVGVWGASAAKVRAAFLLFLYTLFGSLFMLLAIIQIYSYLGATDFALLSVSEISLESQKILWLAFFLAFAIKTPLWPFTGWLFRAHVEAPLSGSVILAAVILKLATYAYLRIMISFLPDATNFYSPLLQGICIITLIYASLSALRSHDSKALVALSSISHCALIVLGLFSNSIIGIEGAILVSLAHGFISPALFIIVGGIIYVRTHSRVIQYIRGLTTYMPILSILFLIFALANASIPLTTGWVGEQMTLIGLFERSPIIGAIGATSIFLTACYSIFLYNRLSFGTYSEHLKPLLDIDRREFIVLFTLLIPTVLFGIWPNLILDSLHAATSEIIYNIPTYRSAENSSIFFPIISLFTSCVPCGLGKPKNSLWVQRQIHSTVSSFSLYKKIPRWSSKARVKSKTTKKISELGNMNVALQLPPLRKQERERSLPLWESKPSVERKGQGCKPLHRVQEWNDRREVRYSAKVKMIIIIWWILLFLLEWKFKSDTFYFYIYLLLLISILIPIILNAIVLILFSWIQVQIKRKGKISVPWWLKNKYSSFGLKIFDVLTGICKEKEVLSYFRKRNTAEILFYTFLLFLYFIIYIYS